MRAAGEVVEDGADDIVRTEFDYALRNTYQISQCEGLFVLTGGDGALEEILPAVIDYDQPVAVVEGAGTASLAVRALLEIYPEWRKNLVVGPHVDVLIDPFLERLSAR